MKIGIFGGAFNPPHKMHKKIVSELIKKGYLNRVIIVPTADNYDKPNLLPGTIRCELLDDIFKNDEKVVVSRFEVDGSLHTINTLNFFRERYPKADIYFICGTDNLAEFDTWCNYEEILKNFKLLVINRDLAKFEKAVQKFNDKEYRNNIELANIEPQVLSSSMIRKEISKNGLTDELKKYLYVGTIRKLQKIDYKEYWKN